MAKFTSDEIDLLTQNASVAPTVQAPTGNVVADVANLATTGLSLFQKRQAQKQLKEAADAEKAYDKKLADAAYKYSRLLGDLEANNLSENVINQRTTAFFRGLGDPQLAMEVESFVKKAGGSTAMSLMNRAETRTLAQKQSQIEQDKREEEAKRKKFELQKEATEASVKAGLSTDGVENETEESLQKRILAGVKAQAEKDLRTSKLAEQIQEGTWKNMTNDQQAEALISASLPEFSTNLSSELNTEIEAAGGLRAADPENLFRILDDALKSLDGRIQQILQNAPKGVTFTPDQIAAYRDRGSAIIDDFNELLTDKNYLSALENIQDKQFSQALVKGLTSSEPATREGSLLLLMQLKLGEPVSFTDKTKLLEDLSSLQAGNLSLGNDADVANTRLNDLAKSTQSGSNSDASFNTQDQERNFAITEEMLDGGSRRLEMSMSSGALTSLVRNIALTKGENLPPEKKQKALSLVKEAAISTMPNAIAQVVNTSRTSTEYKRGEGFTAKPSGVMENYRLDVDTLQFVPIKEGVVVRDTVQDYNEYVSDLYESFKTLGSEQDVKDFKERVLQSNLIALYTEE